MIDQTRVIRRRRSAEFIHQFTKIHRGIHCKYFWVLSLGNGCVYDCAYCFLKITFRHQYDTKSKRLNMASFINKNDMERDLRFWLEHNGGSLILNAGELSDSLITDDIDKNTKFLIPIFAQQKKHCLLFVTKSDCIQNLLDLEPTNQVIISFSINGLYATQRFERNAPSLEQRMRAIDALLKRGWRVRVRIDPMIPYEDWKQDYRYLCIKLNNLQVQPERITIGSLRIFRIGLVKSPYYADDDLKSFLVDHQDTDKRLRIAYALRKEMYQHMQAYLNKGKEVGICKEVTKLVKELEMSDNLCNCEP